MTGNFFNARPPAGSRADLPGGAALALGNERLRPGLPTPGEQLRQDMLTIRRTMRSIMERQAIARNGCILYSGFDVRKQADVFRQFQSWLAQQRYAETVYLEQTDAGEYLMQQTESVLKRHLSSDWNRATTIDDHCAISLMGFWRELSARFARKASGTVHLLLQPERVELLDIALHYWRERLSGRPIDVDAFVDTYRMTAFSGKLVTRISGKHLDARHRLVTSVLGLRLAQAATLAGPVLRSYLGWNTPGAARMLTEELRVLGFVELPVLFGLIATNAGVERICVYTCGTHAGAVVPRGPVAEYSFTQVREMEPRGT